MKWYAQAPSNIALIKYMGKRDAGSNLPDNASFSYTLKHLLSFVCLEAVGKGEDCWVPCNGSTLSTAAQHRFLAHLKRLKDHFGYQGSFRVSSENNFPLGIGIASSASSFAALTRCAASALSMLTEQPELTTDEQAAFSRLGSGSSCRSFYSPWCLWEGEQVEAVTTPYPELIHQVVICSRHEKEVSSSEAHRRVKTSPQYAGRAERASKRLTMLLSAMQNQDWGSMYQICFDEFTDMHHLFETSDVPFSYRIPACQDVLTQCQQYWETHHDGPLVTMDAGSTIHLMYRLDQQDIAVYFKESLFKAYDVL
ncbi:MAG: diphosphomevalonate decarboxylase [Gammaproteobacteria bacterium]|nr:diphosphomevalonate decarboxylase [Gammaproteobacteria bacterium]